LVQQEGEARPHPPRRPGTSLYKM